MTNPQVASPVAGYQVSRVLDQDGAATSYLGVVAGGRAGVLTVGHRVLASPAGQTAFRQWTDRFAGVSGHRGVVDLLGRGFTGDGRPYLVVATAPTALAATLRTDGARGPEEVRAIGVAIADAVAATHAVGLAHGAVRPATILLGGAAPQLAGFDATAPGLAQPLASSPYTAPEHLAAAAAGHIASSAADDVYGLALTLYAALGGRPPWAADDGSGVTDPALRGHPVPDVPGVTPEFLAALRAALAVNPRRRPTAAMLRDMLAATPAATPEPADGQGVHRKAATPVALALLAGVGARPVAEAVITAMAGATTTTAATGAVGGAAGGMVGAAGYATAANPGVALSQTLGGTATGAVGGGATAGATAGTGAVAATGGAGIGGAVAGTGAVGTAAVGIGVGAKIAIAAAVVATVGGGGAAATYIATDGGGNKPTAIESPKLDQSIRKTNFKGITFRDGSTDEDVTLSNGEATVGGDATEFSYKISHGPAYADVDGDGDEDAAMAYTVVNGNGWQQYAYIWRWEGGKPVQMREEFSRDGRCGTTHLDSMASGTNGIAIRIKLIDLSNGCAGQETGTDSFTLGMRGDFPVRVAPLGPVGSCKVPGRWTDLGPRGVTPRVAPDPKAPAIGPRNNYREVVLLSSSSTEVGGYNWFLARLTAEDGKQTCGWISGQEIGSD